MQNKFGWIIGIITLVVIVGLGYLYVHTQSTKISDDHHLDGFAQCLATKKLTMYGAAWCTHCQNEKSHFGASFQYVPYVECPDNTQVCLDKGVEGYPTWFDGNGVKYEGEQGLDGLSRISGCPLPAADTTTN